MSKLVIVGSVAFDAIETPFGKTDKILGGAGTFISIAASNFKTQTNIISVVGYDFPAEYLDKLRRKNINIDGIQIKKDEKTFFWSGRYHENMNKRDTLITELNSLGTFDPVVPETYKDADYLMLGNLSPQVQSSVIERIGKRPKLIAMDTMNFWMDNTPDDLEKTISMVDVLIINDEEARQLSGEYSLLKAARKILEKGLKYLIIKKGEHGALLFDKDKIFFAPALVLEQVFDPTGAGDTFAGGFMGYIAERNDISFDTMKNAVIAGSALASFTVEKFGTERLYEVDRSMMLDRVKEFEEMTKFNFVLD